MDLEAAADCRQMLCHRAAVCGQTKHSWTYLPGGGGLGGGGGLQAQQEIIQAA